MAETRRLKILIEEISERMEVPSGPVVVALSGGADSAMLAWLLNDLASHVRALHVHHGWPDSDRLSEAASEVAAKIGLDFSILEVDAAPGASPEETARRLRYQALEGALAPEESLATAHTLEDQAETVLMNLIRGSGTQGLVGIPSKRGRIIRPLLGVSRSLLREAADLAKLPWIDDPANSDERFLRVKIRQQLIPFIEEEINPSTVDSISRFARLAAADAAYLDSRVPNVLERKSGAVRVPIGVIKAVDPVVGARLVRRMWGILGFEHPPSEATVGKVLETASAATATAQVESGVTVTKEGGFLGLSLSPDRDTAPGPTNLSIPGETRWGSFTFTSTLENRIPPAPLSPRGMLVPISGGEKLEIRAAVRSDRIRCGAGSKTVFEALREGGVAATRRESFPVVLMDGEVIWIPGVRRVGWPRPTQSRYLSTFASEETEWRRYEP